MKPFETLWRSRKFWLAVVAVIQTVVFALIPDFPDEVWAAINVILLWLILWWMERRRIFLKI